MRFLALVSLFLFISLATAEEVDLTIYEERDFGPDYEGNFDELEITMECDKEIIYVQIEDEGIPVTGAIVRIMYIDYSTPLLASGPTDIGGGFDYTLVGEKDFMRGLFLVVVEKEGYKQKEAHFDIGRCIYYEEETDGPLIYDTTPPTIPEPEPEIPPEPEEPPEPLPEPEPETEENLTDIPDLNLTDNETAEDEGTEPEYLCVSSFVLLLAAVLLVLYH